MQGLQQIFKIFSVIAGQSSVDPSSRLAFGGSEANSTYPVLGNIGTRFSCTLVQRGSGPPTSPVMGMHGFFLNLPEDVTHHKVGH